MLTLAEGDIATNGIRLHYYRTGGDRPPLVLLHGFSNSSRCWSHVMEALAADYELIAQADPRAHGKSEAPESGYSSEEMAADVAGLIQGLGLQEPVLLGHSMGAGMALTADALYPGLAKAVVLEDPGLRADYDLPTQAQQEERAQWWVGELQRLKALSRPELIAWLQSDSPAWDPAEAEPWAEAKEQASLKIVEVMRAPRRPWRALAFQVRCPVLLVTGDPERGGIVTAEIAGEAQRLIPRLQWVHVAGTGHEIHREKYAQFVQAVRVFLAGV